jgi:hypothetical protein
VSSVSESSFGVGAGDDRVGVVAPIVSAPQQFIERSANAASPPRSKICLSVRTAFVLLRIGFIIVGGIFAPSSTLSLVRILLLVIGFLKTASLKLTLNCRLHHAGAGRGWP